ncbi:proton-coupled amino acid transporter 3 [Dorcoceras hygrometricum]|uniref:Proton-coupled amino acid transporter 3 n=1 Tax=Dorcoceras hygrometricum TaxID=472368 RepID=A0A2Z7BW56_9LAMI|nr:proton-coupled amino acid transporter 3 [Dorcoceras hygrometricum]
MVMGFQRGKQAGSSSNALLPTEDTPLLFPSGGKPQALSSQLKTFANVFIAIVGAGVLGLPYTFMRTGWLTSLLMILVVAALTYHGMMLLVRTRRKLGDFPYVIASFGDLGFAVSGSIGRFAVDFMIVLSQAGFCVGYLIFISDTLVNLFSSSSSSLLLGPKIWGVSTKSVYIWICFPFQLGLNSIASLTLLAPLSIFADIVDLTAMGIVIVQDSLIFMKQMPVVEAFGTLSTFFYGLGVAVYSFEGIGMALPLESEMKDKSKFGKILGLAMLFIAAMYAAFGAMGYFAFGENTKDIITANMGKGLLSTLVQLGLCINLFFTFPLMMHPVYEVFERRFWAGNYSLLMRWMLVLVVSLVALFVPNFADFLSLVGSSTCCALGFVLPALFHYLAFKEEMSWRQASADWGLIVLGAFLGVLGTWYSLLEIFSIKVWIN